MKHLFLLISFLGLTSLLFGQEGKLYITQKNDTMDVEKSGIKVSIVVKNDTLNFHENGNLLYPQIDKNEDVKSVIVSFKGSDYVFFDKTKSNLPKEALAVMGPFYLDLFNDKRNMYITLKNGTEVFEDFPKELITEEIKEQMKKNHLEIYYQVKTSALIE